MKTIQALLLGVLLMCQGVGASERLPALAATEPTLSGLSSGGFMAVQLGVIYSSRIEGVGVVAGGPYHCAGMDALVADVITAQSRCMNPCALWFWPFSLACEALLLPDGEALSENARDYARAGLIDDPQAIQNHKVYLFSGGEDDTVTDGVVESAKSFYESLAVPADNLLYHQIDQAAHAYISEQSTRACDAEGAPFINDCDYEQARILLQHLYGELQPDRAPEPGELLTFSQSEFLDSDAFTSSGLADEGMVFIPKECRTQSCRIHVAFHGCRQSAADVAPEDLKFHESAGYNPVAAANRIIVLYPQIRAANTMDRLTRPPYNPRGCWDFWGYTDENYYTRDSIQGRAVMAMIQRLQGSPE